VEAVRRDPKVSWFDIVSQNFLENSWQANSNKTRMDSVSILLQILSFLSFCFLNIALETVAVVRLERSCSIREQAFWISGVLENTTHLKILKIIRDIPRSTALKRKQMDQASRNMQGTKNHGVRSIIGSPSGEGLQSTYEPSMTLGWMIEVLWRECGVIGRSQVWLLVVVRSCKCRGGFSFLFMEHIPFRTKIGVAVLA